MWLWRISERTDENDEMEIDLIELFHVLLKKAWVILLCLVIGAVTVGGYTKLFVTPTVSGDIYDLCSW